jgi:hypothetical protein
MNSNDQSTNQSNLIPDSDNESIDDDSSSSSSLDDETRSIIFKSSNKPINFEQMMSGCKTKTKTKSNTKSNSHTQTKLSLSDFTKKVEMEEKINEPKKYVSARIEHKKKELGLVHNPIFRRTFNPRYPPPTYQIPTQNIEQYVPSIKNQLEFPKL